MGGKGTVNIVSDYDYQNLKGSCPFTSSQHTFSDDKEVHVYNKEIVLTTNHPIDNYVNIVNEYGNFSRNINIDANKVTGKFNNQGERKQEQQEQ
eukprot:Pgem_evm1s18177